MVDACDTNTLDCGTASFDAAVDAVRAGHCESGEVAQALVARLEVHERLRLLDGDEHVWPGILAMVKQYNVEPIVAGAIDRLGVPGIRFTDGPRGVVVGRSTCFPVAIARAASFDVELETRIGRAIGVEARAQGANLFAGICVNLLRHPAWGRAQESYGEEPVVLGEMGAALTRGVRENVMACVKHFALNSMEEARFFVDVVVDDDTLHRVYLPHFRRVVDEGVDAVMSAYNRVNGTWCGEHHELLTTILRGTWGFQGIVISDFVWGLRDGVASVRAGLDIEMPFRQCRARELPAALRDGRLTEDEITAAAVRIIDTLLRHYARVGTEVPSRARVACTAHRALAREAAARSFVLLRNDGVLPLGPVSTLAVVGRLANQPNTGDIGSSRVRPPDTVSALEGIRAALPATSVEHAVDGASAVDAAARADAAVVVVGYTAQDEGEAFVETDEPMIDHLGLGLRTRRGRRFVAALVRRIGRLVHRGGGDRSSLRLSPKDETLIRDVAAANARTIVVVIAGSTVLIDGWDEHVQAVLLAWYPGMEGGHAIADVLTGGAEPSGRLPFVIPKRAEHLGPFDARARQVRYGEWWGQRRLDRDGHAAAYPFGFGLGYTTFALRSARQTGPTSTTVAVENTGVRDGRCVVQVYALRDARALVGFTSVFVPAGAIVETKVDSETEPGAVLEVAKFWGDPEAIRLDVRSSGAG